jgi:hypothetical protein
MVLLLTTSAGLGADVRDMQYDERWVFGVMSRPTADVVELGAFRIHISIT